MKEPIKKAIIFGITGQDGSYLCDLLLKKGYGVIGVVRRSSVSNTERIEDHLNNQKLRLVEGDVSDFISVSNIIDKYQADEVYNLAAQSHVKTSFDQPLYTLEVNTQGPLNILEAIKKDSPHSKFYQASTSEMFGRSCSSEKKSSWGGEDENNFIKYQDESTRFVPQSPYAIAKLAAHNFVDNYRESYDIFACSGILFNHESERRGELFVTRKITKWIADFYHWCRGIHIEPSDLMTSDLIFSEESIRVPRDRFMDAIAPIVLPKLRLGNLDSKRDWGHAKDYVRGMWMMLQHDKPDDYILATGESYSVRDFLDCAFKHIGLDMWSDLVFIDPKFYRPSEVDYLCGRTHKANAILGWKSEIDFNTLVVNMVDNDIREKKEKLDW
tara:strand:- start:3038 stop:4189 length:1152 start_codon:yes stop_codon:yes gene_type:complete